MKIELTPEDVSGYLRWEITERGARIIGCDEKFEGAMEIPSRLDGAAVVEIGKKAFAECTKITSVVLPSPLEDLAFDENVDLVVDDDM